MDFAKIAEGIIVSLVTIGISSMVAYRLIPELIRPKLKIKTCMFSGNWVHVVVKNEGWELAKNCMGSLVLKTQLQQNDLLAPNGTVIGLFLMPSAENLNYPEMEMNVHWARRPNPSHIDIQPGATSIANLGLFTQDHESLIVMSEEPFEGEEDEQRRPKPGIQRMRLKMHKTYEFEFFITADNAKPSTRCSITLTKSEAGASLSWKRL